MGAIYFISILMLLITFILVKKTEKQINILSFVLMSIVLLFCYNTFICYILSFFTIQVKLWILSLVNGLISTVFLILIIKNKETQKYVFNIIDFISIFSILLVVIIISYMNFGFPFDIKYEMGGDSATHFLASAMFAKSDYILGAETEKDMVFGTLRTLKPASYVNSGLLMKTMCPEVDTFECYNLFVVFGIFVLFLTGAMMYATLTFFASKPQHKIWALFIAIICMLGYPLNSFLFGFEYLSMSLLIICAILFLNNYYHKGILSLNWFIPIMALVNLGLFLSYYMFVVFIYPAQWIYFCVKNYRDTKKIITKKLIVILLITLLVPFIMGYIYTIAPKLYKVLIDTSTAVEDILDNSSYLLNNGFKTDGYMYINFYSNMLLLLPLPIYLFISDIRNKKTQDNIFIYLVIIFAMAFIGLLFIGNKIEKVSVYYLSKNYFALWIILLYSNYKALIALSENSKYLPSLFLYLYVFFMIVSTIVSDVKVEYYLKNPYENIFAVMDIFGANKDILLNKQEEFNQKEIEILQYIKDNLDENLDIEFVTDENAYYWQYVILQHLNESDNNIEYEGQTKLLYKYQFLENRINEVDYIVCFYKSNKYNELKDKLLKNAEIIYENESGGILKYNR